ncbi:hypothetical protein AB4K20DRAFT_1883210 [Rhizopus microsporus]
MFIFFSFIKGFEHRERKGYLYSNKQQTLDYITNTLCKRTIPNEPYRLCNLSTSREQRVERQLYRRNARFQGQYHR